MQKLRDPVQYGRIIQDPDHWFETSVFIGEGGVLIDETGDVILFGDGRETQPGDVSTEPTAISVAKISPEYGIREDNIRGISTSIQMFSNGPQIGTAVSGEIDIEFEGVVATLPSMARIIPYVRALCDGVTGSQTELYDGKLRIRDKARLIDSKVYFDEDTVKYRYIPGEANDVKIVFEPQSTERLTSEWIQQGTYFIDTREISKNDDGLDILKIHGFDAMLKFDREFDENDVKWPIHGSGDNKYTYDTEAVLYFANQVGVRVDPRTYEIMTDEFMIPMPIGYTYREVLGYIAGAYAGSFVMSDTGELMLVSITEIAIATDYLIDDIGDVITFGRSVEQELVGENQGVSVVVSDIEPGEVGATIIEDMVLELPYKSDGYSGETISQSVDGTVSKLLVGDWSYTAGLIYGGTWDVLTGLVTSMYDEDGVEYEDYQYYQTLPVTIELVRGETNVFTPSISNYTLTINQVTDNAVRILVNPR